MYVYETYIREHVYKNMHTKNRYYSPTRIFITSSSTLSSSRTDLRVFILLSLFLLENVIYNATIKIREIFSIRLPNLRNDFTIRYTIQRTYNVLDTSAPVVPLLPDVNYQFSYIL